MQHQRALTVDRGIHRAELREAEWLRMPVCPASRKEDMALGAGPARGKELAREVGVPVLAIEPATVFEKRHQPLDIGGGGTPDETSRRCRDDVACRYRILGPVCRKSLRGRARSCARPPRAQIGPVRRPCGMAGRPPRKAAKPPHAPGESWRSSSPRAAGPRSRFDGRFSRHGRRVDGAPRLANAIRLRPSATSPARIAPTGQRR